MSIPDFPTLAGISWPVKRTPSGSTARHESVSGKRTLLPQRSVPRWTWEIPYEFLRSAKFGDGSFSDLETLCGFYLQQMMAGTCFAYTDAEDYAVTAQGFGAGDAATTKFQLVRTRGGFVEPVYLPTITSLTVGGVTKVQGTDFTLGTTGVVTFGAAPGAAAALVWTGTFKWLCRFDEDTLDLSRFMVGLSDAKSVKFSNEIAP